MAYAFIVCWVALPHFAFIAGSADIYISRFGLSEHFFSYVFAVNALAFMGGALLCTRLLHRLKAEQIMTLGFSGLLVGGVIILMKVFPASWSLTLPMTLISFSLGLSRPPSNNLVLDQVGQHAGAASSLLVFILFIWGAFSMWLISFDWSDKIQVIGILATGAGVLTLSLWSILAKRESAAIEEL